MTGAAGLSAALLQHAEHAPFDEALERLQLFADSGDSKQAPYAAVLVARGDLTKKQLRRLEKAGPRLLPADEELLLLKRLVDRGPNQGERLARLAVVAMRCDHASVLESACEALAMLPCGSGPELVRALRALDKAGSELGLNGGSTLPLSVLDRRRELVPEDVESRLIRLQWLLVANRLEPKEATCETIEIGRLLSCHRPPFQTGLKTVRRLLQAQMPQLAWPVVDALAEHENADSEVHARALAVARAMEDPEAVARSLERADQRLPADRKSGIAGLRALMAVHDLQGALARARSLVESRPVDTEVQAAAADVIYRAGCFAEAEVLYQGLVESLGLLEHRLRQTECLMELSRWEEAERACGTGWDEEPALLRLQAARIARFRGDFEKAESRLSPLLEVPQVAVEAQRLLAELRELQDRPAEAYAIRRKLLVGGRDPAEEANELRYLGYRIGCFTEALAAHAERREAAELRRHVGTAWRPGQPLCPPVVCLAEGGIGDEIRDARWYGRIANVGSACATADPRLASLLRRSFPGLEVMPLERTRPRPMPGVDRSLSRLADDTTLARVAAAGTALLSGDLFWAAHAEPQPPAGAYLVPNQALRLRWRERLRALGERPKVGVFWRSGSVTYRRDEFYTRLADWKPLIDSVEAEWIVLQHDLEPEEIASAGPSGAALRCLDELDPRNDMEGLAALMAELDAVVGPGSATAELAGAVDAPTLFLMPRREAYYGWRIADPDSGADRLYSRTRHVVAERHCDGASLFARAAVMLPRVLALREFG